MSEPTTFPDHMKAVDLMTPKERILVDIYIAAINRLLLKAIDNGVSLGAFAVVYKQFLDETGLMDPTYTMEDFANA